MYIIVQPSHIRKMNVQRESEKDETERVSNGYKCLTDLHKTDERESYQNEMKSMKMKRGKMKMKTKMKMKRVKMKRVKMKMKCKG